MKHFIRKAAAALLSAALTACLLATSVFAKTEETSVTVETGTQNYMFDIAWENIDAQAAVVLTAPDGNAYSVDNMPEATVGDGELQFFFAAPVAGEWKISITGEGLGRVTVDSGVMPGRMDITSFSVTVTGTDGTAAWTVADSEENLSFEIWATPSPDGYGGSLLASLSGKAADQGTFSLTGLDSGEYYFYLKAVGTGGIWAEAYASGGPFGWRSPGAQPALDGVRARLLDDEVWLTWDESAEADAYRVMVTDADSGEILYDEEVTDDVNWYGRLPESTKRVYAAVAARRGGVTGDYRSYELQRTSFDGVEVTFPEGEQRNTAGLIVQVAFTGDYQVSASLNGEMLCENSAKTGDYQVTMAEGDNLLTFYVTDEAGNIASYAAEYHVDTIAPALSITENLDGASVSEDHVWLSGLTESGAVLTLNGREQETQSGYFNLSCPLHVGKNTLCLTAIDGAGNETVYTAVVHRLPAWGELLGWIGCAVLFGVLCTVYIRRFVRAGRERGQTKAGGEDGKKQS